MSSGAHPLPYESVGVITAFGWPLWFVGGKNAGREQTFVTPGLVLGRFPLADHLGLTVGAGVQIAVSEFHTQNHTIILSTRLPF